jgi:quinoprotein glucose dehydrogenase
VPQSTVPGEHTSPTQPFPTRPPAFDRQGLSDDDLIDYTPALKARAREVVKDYILGGLYAPPSLVSDEPGGKKGTLKQPGGWGSANWNTGAFDPETSIYYAVSMSLPGPGIQGVVKQTDPEATMDYASRGGQPAAPAAGGAPATPEGGQNLGGLNVEGLPVFKGPYGRITALDLSNGTEAWMVPNGDGPRHHPALRDLNLPPLGVPNRPAPLLTKTLLFLGEGSNSVIGTPRVDWAWGKTFRAYDKATGKVIAELELPSGTTAGPMTYMAAGKQFIVVAIGDNDHAPEYVALALP